MAECPDYGWDFLNKSYTEQQCFKLDYRMLFEGKDKTVQPEEDADLTPSLEEVHQDSAEKEVSCYEERNCCLEVLTESRNGLYCIKYIDILKESKTKFTEINQYWCVPLLSQPLQKCTNNDIIDYSPGVTCVFLR